MYRIAVGDNVPTIPKHLSEAARDFAALCLQRDPCARPSVAALAAHAFLQCA